MKQLGYKDVCHLQQIVLLKTNFIVTPASKDSVFRNAFDLSLGTSCLKWTTAFRCKYLEAIRLSGLFLNQIERKR
jgi:hypothetical protein